MNRSSRFPALGALTCLMLAGACGDVRPRLIGPWHGQGTFTQIRNGVATTLRIPVAVEFSEEGRTDNLPALGFVSAWRAYESGPQGTKGVAQEGPGPEKTVWAYCRFEADGDANELTLEPTGTTTSLVRQQWSYDVRYRFPDLTRYSLYDYNDPDAPVARVSAQESFHLETRSGVETLTVHGSSRGTLRGPAGTETVSLELEGTLARGEPTDWGRCNLGGPLP